MVANNSLEVGESVLIHSQRPCTIKPCKQIAKTAPEAGFVIGSQITLFFPNYNKEQREVNIKSANKLQTCQCKELVLNKFKDIVEAGNGEDFLGVGFDGRENQTMIALGQGLVEFEEFGDAG